MEIIVEINVEYNSLFSTRILMKYKNAIQMDSIYSSIEFRVIGLFRELDQ